MVRTGAFISYARADGEGFADALRTRLTRDAPDIDVWQDRPQIEGGVGWWRQIEEALQRVEFLVIVMTPGVLASETTRKEWRAARQGGVCVFPVAGPGFRFDDPRLPGWMKRVHIYDLDVQWESFVAHLRRGCRIARVPFMAPPLPSSFVPRTREFAALLALVLDSGTRETIAITTTLAGAGGFGKTTLAAALCHDDEIVAAFDDGVLWAILGQTPGIQGELTRLYAALTGERPGFVSIEDAAQSLAEKLEHRRCLIVVDDVWDAAHLKPFLRGGAHCTRLVTTRQAQVAAEGQPIAVDEMTSQEAVSLLVARLGTRPTDPRPFQSLARRLGEWPLLLKLVGAALRQRVDRGDSLAGALLYVGRALDKRGIAAFDRDRSDDRTEAVMATLRMSMDLLDAESRRRCIELAIFAEDIAIPSAVLGELWGLSDPDDVEDRLSRLHDASLIDFDLGMASVRVHDVMRSCFASLLGDEVPATHDRMLAAWTDLRRLPHRYAWQWVGHHLSGAKRGDALRALLLDFDWLRSKLHETDVYAVLSDLSLLPPDRESHLLVNVLQLSSHVLAKDKSQLATQLIGRLADPERAIGMTFIDQAWTSRQPWLRPMTPSLTGPGGALVRTLESPGKSTSLAVSPDGRWIVSCTDEGVVSVWEFSTGTLVRTSQAGDADPRDAMSMVAGGPASTLAMRNDGRVLIAGRRGLSLWDPTADAPPQPVARISDVVRSVAVSADGRQALLGSRNGILTLVDLDQGGDGVRLVADRLDAGNGETIAQNVAHRLGIAAVAIGGDGRIGLTGSYDKTLRAWDLVERRLIDTLYPPHDGIAYAVATARDRPVAVSGSADRTLRVWDLNNLTCRATLTGHRHRVYHVALSDDGETALSASHDRTIKVWDTRSGTALATLRGHSDAVIAVAFGPGERSVVSAAKDETIRIWQLDANEQRATTQEHDGWIQSVAITPDGRVAATGGQDQKIRFWDVGANAVRQVLEGHGDAVSAIALHPPQGIAVSGSYDRSVIVWKWPESRMTHVLKGHSDGISALVISADGGRVLSASSDGDVIVWDIVSGRILHRWEAHRRGITALCTLHDWRIAVTGSIDGTIKLWDLTTFACLQALRAHLDGVTALAVSPSGEWALSGGVDGALRLWRLPAWEMTRAVPAHTGRVRALCFAAGGRVAFSGSYDRYLKAWAIPALEPTSAFAADAAIAAAAASESGAIVVAGDAQGCAHFLGFDGAR